MDRAKANLKVLSIVQYRPPQMNQPEEMKGLRLDYESLCKVNPRHGLYLEASPF